MAFLDHFSSRYNRTIEIQTLSTTIDDIGQRVLDWTASVSDVKCFITPNTQEKESRHRTIKGEYDTIVSQYKCRLSRDYTVNQDDRLVDDQGVLYTVIHKRPVSGFGSDDHQMLYLNVLISNE